MKVIARHQEGITLNPLEFVLDENDKVITFENDDKAVQFLNENFGTELTKEEWEENEGVKIIDE